MAGILPYSLPGMTRFLAPILALSCFAATTEFAAAQAPAAAAPKAEIIDPNDHPATAVVIQYLNHALRHEWKEATDLITDRSLKSVHRGWVSGVKRNSPTIDSEIRAVGLIGKKSLKEVEDMDPADFYAAYHEAQQKEFAMTQERLDQIMKSLQVNVLSAGAEGDDLIHILVRTNHIDGDVRILNLELVSLKKTDAGWRVSLMEKGAKVGPIEEE